MKNYCSIKLLSKEVSNQIAAGEVIERPASVVKELIENSIDAGATNISIDIESGGMKMIRVIDNGFGIRKNDLNLVLNRHTTSKIYTIDDLDHITSMGFRGEALSSISSVSRIFLTSHTIGQKEAWQIYTECSNMIFYLKPVAYNLGTTVEVLDLFFNVPARRKFMYTIKNEFLYIHNVIRSIALSHFNIQFELKNNGKIIKKYCSVINDNITQKNIRINSLCNSSFVENSIELSYKDDDLDISGWLVNPNIKGINLSKIQYLYINNRIIKDSFIKRIILQIYNELLIVKNKPAFILFLKIDPYEVDVNVHPKKNKIKFLNLRKVHSFIYKAIYNILNKNLNKTTILVKNKEYKNTNLKLLKNKKKYNEKQNKIYKNEILCIDNKNILNRYSSSSMITSTQEDIIKNELFLKENISELFDDKLLNYINNNKKQKIRILNIYKNKYALIEDLYNSNIFLLSLQVVDNFIKEQQLIPKNGKSLYAYPILIPPRVTIDIKQSESLKNNKKLLYDMGIILKLIDNFIIIKAVPLVLRDQNVIKLIPELLYYMNNKLLLTYKKIALWFIKKIKIKLNKIWDYSKTEKLLLDIDRFYPLLFKEQQKKFLIKFNLKEAINTLNNE